MGSLAVGQVHEAAVEKLVYGGDGLVRIEGAVVFVPFAAAGDRLRVRITEVTQRIAGLDYAFGAGTFFQANRLLVDTLVAEAAGGASGRLAVDLYAGAGLFALQLAQCFEEVMAVEDSAAAARDGAANAARNSLRNVRFEAVPVESWLATRPHDAMRPDLVLLDPPRTGAGRNVVLGIAALAPPSVTYVSCDPATLARDLRTFLGSGYSLASVVVLDMFPQSTHVETVALLDHRTRPVRSASQG